MNEKFDPDPQAENPPIENEFVWALRPLMRKLMMLLSCWTTPFEQVHVETFTKDDGVKARALALFLIAALTFAVRSEPAGEHPTEVFTVFAGGVAIILSVLLNLISRRFHVKETVVISAYVSTILVMFFYVVVENALLYGDPVLYENISAGNSGIVLPAAVAGLITLIILLLKSKWQGSQITDRHTLKQAVTLTGGSTIIVIVVALMKSEAFAWVARLAELIGKSVSQ